TMNRLGIHYDVLPRESEILHLKFWETAFEQLKQRQAIYFETEGKNKGCWVMPASDAKPPAPAPTPVAITVGATLSVVKPEDGPDLNFESGKGKKKRTREQPARALVSLN